MAEDSREESFFEEMYQRAPDPWRFATSSYEQGRYAAILRLLETRRFRRAFEPGCSIGVLTERLANICDLVEAMDISGTAIRRTRERCQSLGNVRATRGALPDTLPDGSFDLIVLSEVGYYLDAPTLTTLTLILIDRLDRGGILLAAHWLGESPDHVLSGDQVHELIGAVPGLAHLTFERHEGFRIDKWARE